MIFQRRRIADELEKMNLYLLLIAEVIQKEEKFPWLHQPRVTVNVPKQPPLKMDFPQPVIDASELLSRWLWLQLPDESKEDLTG